MTDGQDAPPSPQEDRRPGKGVRVCADESRPAAGADLTSSLTIRPTQRKAAGPVAHAGTGGITKADRTAADRVLKAAVRRAVHLIRAGQDCRPVLASAEVAADLLIGDAA